MSWEEAFGMHVKQFRFAIGEVLLWSTMPTVDHFELIINDCWQISDGWVCVWGSLSCRTRWRDGWGSMQRSRKNFPSDRSRIIVLDSSWVNQCFSCMHKTGNPTRERLSDQHQRAFASPAYSLTAPINNSIKLQNMSSAAMLLPCIGKRMINIHRGWFACVCLCVMSPTDGIGVKVGLKICWVWVKVHPWQAGLHNSHLTDPLALIICGQPHIMQNASLCILASEASWHFLPRRNTLLKEPRKREKNETWMFTWTCQPLNSWPIVVNSRRRECMQWVKENTAAVCVSSTLIGAFFKDLCYQTKFHFSLTVKTLFAAKSI